MVCLFYFHSFCQHYNPLHVQKIIGEKNLSLLQEIDYEKAKDGLQIMNKLILTKYIELCNKV